MKRHIPNCITLLNQMSGIVACIAAYNYRFGTAMLFMLIAAMFDFFDGAAARALKVSSPIGKELDSLADMISFGFLPGMVAFRLLTPLADAWTYLPYLGFVITLFSALRLAKFNVDTRQTDSFIGLATPANAILWVGIAYNGYPEAFQSTTAIVVTLIGIVLSAWLLVSEIPMFSLKFHNFRWADNLIRYIFLFGVVVLAIVFRLHSLPYIILWYLVVSIITAIATKRKASK